MWGYQQEKSEILGMKKRMNNRKKKFEKFCNETYVPIYSQPWWLDIICGENNWDVWLYEKGEEILAAMPYFLQKRGKYNYITKAPLTQNNGIIFKHNNKRKLCTRAEFEEKVISAACEFIDSLNIDVYEQQYMYTFKNWLPFFWKKYSAITRYTYVIENTFNLDEVWNNISSNYRNKIKKGSKNCFIEQDVDKEQFYKEHEKIFLKQNLECPFSKKLWFDLYEECKERNSGMTLVAKNEDNVIQSVLFLVWDDKSVYQILGGNIPEYQKQDTYAFLIWNGIQISSNMGKIYDFEGSVIPRISKSFREFGGEPKPYFRIRKVFNPEIIKQESNKIIEELERNKI